MIEENIKYVTQRIAKCCKKSGRAPEDVKLICVTKTASIEDIKKALDLGIYAIGENRVQEAVGKYAAIGKKVEWHLIGHLQTNKVKDAIKIFSLIHSVDSAHLAKDIDKESCKIGKIQDILIQVNTSGEGSKFGVSASVVEDLIKEISIYPNISIKGLMTIAPEVKDPETVRPYFGALRELRDKLNAMRSTKYEIRILSMGMTNDFEVAIEEGANMIRIGRAIFEGMV